MKSNSVSQKDIAIALNVSVNTVSHALRNMNDISKETIERVKCKALELGYVPNATAIKLKTGSTKTIALVYDSLINPYFTIMANKLVSKIKEVGYDTIIYPCENYYELDNERFFELVSMQVDGVLSFLDISPSLEEKLPLYNLPIVVVGRKSKYNLPSIYLDDFKGGELVGKYFKEKGYKKILYAAPEKISISSMRYAGLVSIYKEENIVQREFLETDDVHNIVDEIKKNNVDAVFAFNDVLASLINKELAKQNINMEVAGFDNISGLLPYFDDIVSVGYDFDEVTNLSVASLLKLFNNDVMSDKTVELPVYLHIKGEKQI